MVQTIQPPLPGSDTQPGDVPSPSPPQPGPDTFPHPEPDPDPIPAQDPDLPRPGEVVPPVRARS